MQSSYQMCAVVVIAVASVLITPASASIFTDTTVMTVGGAGFKGQPQTTPNPKNVGFASCDSDFCSIVGCERPNAACCSSDTRLCYYNNFWFDWSCCDSASCCGKMNGPAIAVIVFLVLMGVVGICACVWCCCCRQRNPPLVATATTTYVVMPSGNVQPVVVGQPVVMAGGSYQQPNYNPQPMTGATGYQQFQNQPRAAYRS